MAKDKKIQGEGDYEAARNYQKEQEEFARDEERVKQKAREAAEAVDSEEGEELEEARRKSTDGPDKS